MNKDPARLLNLILLLLASGLGVLTSASDCGDGLGPPPPPPRLSPDWTLDGSRIVFGEHGVHVVESDGSRLYEVNPLVSGAGIYSPTISPEGTVVAYVTRRYKSRYYNWEIATSGIDGTNERRLTKNDTLDANPVWSPDGSQIAYTGASSQDSSPRVHIMNRDGSGQVSVAPSIVASLEPPSWSPDGQRLMFTGREQAVDTGSDQQFSIFVVGRDGSGLTKLGTGSMATWSPSGRHVAFVGYEDQVWKVYTMSSEGSQLREVAALPLGILVAELLWSPDGAHLLFVSLSNDRYDYFYHGSVYVTHLDGSHIQMVVEADAASASWSPDGSRVAVYRKTSFDSNVVLYTIAPDGSDERVLVREGNNRLVSERQTGQDAVTQIPACSTGLIVPNPGDHPDLIKDCETLLRAKRELAGPGVVLNWDATTPISSWAGVGVYEDPSRVGMLHLWDLAGTIPGELGNLTGIESLELRGVVGTIPPELGKLSQLRQLVLVGNGLTGEIPEELTQLDNLEVLALDNNYLTGKIPPEVWELPALRYLTLDQNRFDISGSCIPAGWLNNEDVVLVTDGVEPC